MQITETKMIKYKLNCKNNHEFESWFANSSEFEKLKKKNLLECIYCDSKKYASNRCNQPELGQCPQSAWNIWKVSLWSPVRPLSAYQSALGHGNQLQD